MDLTDRRKFIGGVSSAVLTSVLAGCANQGGNNGGGGETTSTETATPTETTTSTQTASPTETATPTETETSNAPTENATTTSTNAGENGSQQQVSSWLSGANYDGSLEDLTGSNMPTVKVGAKSKNGYFAFEPAAIRISTGTKVTWQWTGKGGVHNVVAKSDAFTSGEPLSENSATYTHTFEESGVYLYYCTPHRSLGMKGAVIVK